MATFGLRADPDLQRKLLASATETVTRRAGDRLFVEGEAAHGLYLIKSGKLRLSLDGKRKKIMQRSVGQDCLVGLPGSITGRVYSLSCEVVEDAELTYVSRDSLMGLMQRDTEAAMKLLSLLSSEVQGLRAEIGRPRPASLKRSKHTH